MATFKEHVTQLNNNLRFLEHVNGNAPNYWDWQVTAAFYVCVHLVNAHIASQINEHYKSHKEVYACLNPTGGDAKCKLTPAAFINYGKLEALSRRSRYLCHEVKENDDNSAKLTHDRHLAKAIKNLDALLTYLNTVYPGNLFIGKKIKIKCQDLKGFAANYFEIVK